jgi:hypothetical protein
MIIFVKNTTMEKTAMQEWVEWLKAYEYELPLELQIKSKELLVLEKQQHGKTWDEAIDEYSKYNTFEQYYTKTFNK